MRRRDLLAMIGSVAVARPLVARAQQPTMPLIAVSPPGTPEPTRRYVAAFRKGLSEAGYRRRSQRGDRVSLGGKSI